MEIAIAIGLPRFSAKECQREIPRLGWVDLYFGHVKPTYIHLSSVQKPSLIPLNPGWFIGIPLLDYYNPQYIG